MRRRKKTRSILSIVIERTVKFVRQYQLLTNEDILIIGVGVFILFLFGCIIWKILMSDPCDGSKITRSLCAQYEAGEIAGSLCYSMCLEHEEVLTYCVKEDGNIKTFLSDDIVVRVNSDLGFDDSDLSLQEGTTVAQLRDKIKAFLEQTHGHASIDLLLKLLLFSDFNHDEKINLGEAQSIWHLIHIPEFMFHFLFQKSLVFPSINGTCGNLYTFQYTPNMNLYKKDSKSWFSKIFTNSYKWGLPNWVYRAKLSVGLLEFVMDIYEEFDNQYLMCNIGPDRFGYTYKHELSVGDVSGIVSADIVKWYLKNISCDSDSECMYSKQCFSQCDVTTQRCDGQVIRPGLWFVCDMLRDYILFDAPRYLYFDLKRLLNKCSELDARRQGFEVEHALLQQDLKSVLWNEIQNSV